MRNNPFTTPNSRFISADKAFWSLHDNLSFYKENKEQDLLPLKKKKKKKSEAPAIANILISLFN